MQGRKNSTLHFAVDHRSRDDADATVVDEGRVPGQQSGGATDGHGLVDILHHVGPKGGGLGGGRGEREERECVW